MHLSMREGISRQSNTRFSMLMFVVVCLGIFSAFMTNTQVAAQLTQAEQDILNQSQTLVNETNEIFKELAGNVTEFSLVQIALASLPTSTNQTIKQQMLDKARTLFNQITELRLELDAHLALLSNISNFIAVLLTASTTTSMHTTTTTTTTTTAKPTSTVKTTQQPTGIIDYLVRRFDFEKGTFF